MMRENLASHAYADDDSDRESDHDKAEMTISVQDVDKNLSFFTKKNFYKKCVPPVTRNPLPWHC